MQQNQEYDSDSFVLGATEIFSHMPEAPVTPSSAAVAALAPAAYRTWVSNWVVVASQARG